MTCYYQKTQQRAGMGLYYGRVGMGDVNVAGWKAGTVLTYTNGPLYHNSFSGYDIFGGTTNIKNSYDQSGLFVPGSVQVVTQETGILGTSGDTIRISGILANDTTQVQASNDIEGLIKNYFVSNPATAIYSPVPNLSQVVSSSSGSPVSTPVVAQTTQKTVAFYDSSGGPAFPTQTVQQGNGTSFVFSDGSDVFVGNDGTIAGADANGNDLEVTISPDGTIANFSDGSIAIFSQPAGSPSPGSQTVRTVNTPPPPGGNTSGIAKILADLGLGNVSTQLGIGAGATLALVAIVAYMALKK